MRNWLNKMMLMIALVSLTACGSNQSIKKTNKNFLRKYGDNVEILNERQQRKYGELSRMDDKKRIRLDRDNKKSLIGKEIQRREYIRYLESKVEDGSAYFDASLLPSKYMYDIEARPNEYVANTVNNTAKFNSGIDCQDGTDGCRVSQDLFYSAKNRSHIQTEDKTVDFNSIQIPHEKIQNYRARFNKTMLFAESNEELQASLDFMLVKRYKTEQLEAEEREAERQELERIKQERSILGRVKSAAKSVRGDGEKAATEKAPNR